MKHFFLSLTLMVFTPALFAQNNSTDETNIKEVIKQQENAWNKYDWESFSSQFDDDATLINFVGQFWKGRNEILTRFKQISDCCLSSTSIKFEVENIRFLKPDIAIVYINETLVATKDYNTPFHQYKKDEVEYKMISDVFIKAKNGWQIIAMQVALINQLLTPHNDSEKH